MTAADRSTHDVDPPSPGGRHQAIGGDAAAPIARPNSRPVVTGTRLRFTWCTPAVTALLPGPGRTDEDVGGLPLETGGAAGFERTGRASRPWNRRTTA